MTQIRDYSYQELCIFARSFVETPGVLPERAGWENIAIEYHPLGPPAECERYLLRHNIRIPLNSVLLEQRIDTGSHMHHALQPGDLLLTPANSQEWLHRQEQEEFLLLYLEPDLLAQIAGKSALARFYKRFQQERVMRDPLLFQIALALRAEMQRANSHFSTIYTQELANAFAAHLLRRYGDWEPESASPMEHLFTMKIKQVIEYIHGNLSEPLTLSELARLASISPYHFTRIFKQTIGLSPRQYILGVRIEEAKRLLLRGEVPLTRIAAQLGFYDQSHFTRVFRRLVGLSPRVFLMEHRKNIPG